MTRVVIAGHPTWAALNQPTPVLKPVLFSVCEMVQGVSIQDSKQARDRQVSSGRAAPDFDEEGSQGMGLSGVIGTMARQEKGSDRFCSAMVQAQQGSRAEVIASVVLGDAMHGNRIEGWDSCLPGE